MVPSQPMMMIVLFLAMLVNELGRDCHELQAEEFFNRFPAEEAYRPVQNTGSIAFSHSLVNQQEVLEPPGRLKLENPAAEVTSDAQYWIVSTRHLPHDVTGCPKIPDFCVMKRDAYGKLVQGTIGEMQGWINPGEPVLLMVHGSFVDWELSVKDAHGTYCWMKKMGNGRPIKMIFLSWPSDGPYTKIPVLDVTRSGKRGAYDGIYLSYLIDYIPVSSPICLMGHSHGARVISSALHFRAGGEIFDCCRGQVAACRRIRVIFAAAALDHNWLNPGNRYGRALTQTECLVNLQNRHDAALLVYPLVVPFSAQSIARTGFTRRDSIKQGGLAFRTTEYDVTRDIGCKHTWPNYYERDEIGQLLAPYVFNWYAPIMQSQDISMQLKP